MCAGWRNRNRNVGVVTVATLITVLASQWLGLGHFAAMSLLASVSFSVMLTVLAYAAFYAVALAVYGVLRYKQPGFVVFTVEATVGGSLAAWCLSYATPDMVLLTGLLPAAAYAFTITMVTWALAYLFGILKPGLTFWPKWR